VTHNLDNAPIILVVDDDPEVLQLMVNLLGRVGFRVVTAANAADAAKLLQRAPRPSLIILDMMMPKVSGMDFLHQVRARSNYDSIPIVVLSAISEPERIREALNSGADRYITKPYLANNLVTTVRGVLEAGRAARA
jgi:CheY-like chemotaxis protein